MYAFDKDCQNIIVLFQAWTREKQAFGRQTPLRYQVCKSLYCIVHFWQWDIYIEDLNINEVRMRIIHCHSSLCDDGSKLETMGWVDNLFFCNIVMKLIREQKIVTKVIKDLFPGNFPFWVLLILAVSSRRTISLTDSPKQLKRYCQNNSILLQSQYYSCFSQ